MLVDVEQVMRVAFRPVGQTELQRWLADLGSKDGVPPLTREAPPEPPAVALDGRTAARRVGPGVGPRAHARRRGGGALRRSPAATTARAPTEVMKHPPQFASADRVWHRKPAVRIAGAAAVLLLGALVSARALSGPPTARSPPWRRQWPRAPRRRRARDADTGAAARAGRDAARSTAGRFRRRRPGRAAVGARDRQGRRARARAGARCTARGRSRPTTRRRPPRTTSRATRRRTETNHATRPRKRKAAAQLPW